MELAPSKNCCPWRSCWRKYGINCSIALSPCLQPLHQRVPYCGQPSRRLNRLKDAPVSGLPHLLTFLWFVLRMAPSVRHPQALCHLWRPVVKDPPAPSGSPAKGMSCLIFPLVLRNSFSDITFLQKVVAGRYVLAVT